MDETPRLPGSLLARIRADPIRAPEHIALVAAERHGPAAKTWAARRHGSPERMARAARRTHARYARLGGAATGVGGALTLLPDLAASAWIQSRVVFFIAAAYGFDPLDRMRPAELLVLFELYDDVSAARQALDGTGRTVAGSMVRRTLDRGEDRALLTRLAQMALRRGASRLAGRAIPGLAMAVNAVGNERAVRDIAGRAMRFYGG